MRASLLAVALLVTAIARPCPAQQLVLGGDALLSSGLQAGGAGKLLLERSRTRLTLGVDFRTDEFPKDIVAISAVAELEPHSSFGVDVSYHRRVGPKLEFQAGGIGIIYPESFIGPECGATYHLPMSKGLDLLVGAELDVFILGTDLPSDSVVWNLVLKVGAHVDL